jgi:hypothetical protein
METSLSENNEPTLWIVVFMESASQKRIKSFANLVGGSLHGLFVVRLAVLLNDCGEEH